MVVYLRITYLLQVLTASNLLLSLLLPWHRATHSPLTMFTYSVSRILNSDGTEPLVNISWWVVGLVLPVVVVTLWRAIQGMFSVERMDQLRLARRSGYLSVITLGWFYLVTSLWGHTWLQFGFWLSLQALVILLILLWIETSFPSREQKRAHAHILCPNCGGINPPRTRLCRHCGFVLMTRRG
jgi:ribosomal protein L40E